MTRAPTHRPLGDDLYGQYTPIDDATAAAWRAAGWWEGRSIRSLLSEAATTHLDRTALVGYRTDGSRVSRTYREFDSDAHHAAAVFAALGIGAGDVVALMLPNWVECPEMVFGINEIGAIYAGIPLGCGHLQAAAILCRTEAKILVIPRRWRSTEHLELSRALRAEIPTLEHVIVLDDDDTGLVDGESLWRHHDDVPLREFPDPRPSRICYLGFTSGTTGEPKGAMHNHDTLLYSARRQAEHVGPTVYGDPIVQLVASPVGHHTGFLWGIVFTVLLAGTGVYIDRWEPPDGMSYEEAAACGLVYSTAHFGLLRRAQLKHGETVLVTGAGGGVGSAGVQLAKAWGARVIALAQDDAKGDLARQQGADVVVTSRPETVRDDLLAATDGRGVARPPFKPP